jgi:hypothetical protein
VRTQVAVGSPVELQLTGARLQVAATATVSVNGLACAIANRTTTTLACTLAAAPANFAQTSAFVYVAMDAYSAFTSVRPAALARRKCAP